MIWGHTCRSQPGRWSRGRCLWHDENSWKEVPVSTVFKHPFTIIPVSHTLGEARVSANVDKRRSSYSNEKIIYKWKVWTREYLKLETMIHRPNVNVLMGSWMCSLSASVAIIQLCWWTPSIYKVTLRKNAASKEPKRSKPNGTAKLHEQCFF